MKKKFIITNLLSQGIKIMFFLEFVRNGRVCSLHFLYQMGSSAKRNTIFQKYGISK